MAVELIKETQGKTSIVDNLFHQEKVKCDGCDQTYQFRYSKAESHRLKEWLPKARTVVNNNHVGGHSEPSLPVPW